MYWRKPAFASAKTGGKVRGEAVHRVMQHIRYEACHDAASIAEELTRLQQAGLITEAQAAMVDCHKLQKFFATEIGRKLLAAPQVLREFKFSILEPADPQNSELAGEQVLMQGVVDCAIIEDDGIIVVDFKTDRVTKETEAIRAQRYAPQVQTYADAISRIYRMPVKAKALYFFHTDSFYWL